MPVYQCIPDVASKATSLPSLIVRVAFLSTVNASLVTAIIYLLVMMSVSSSKSTRRPPFTLRDQTRWLHLGDCLLICILLNLLINNVTALVSTYAPNSVFIFFSFALGIVLYPAGFTIHIISVRSTSNALHCSSPH